MGNRDSAFSRSYRGRRSFRLNPTVRAIAFIALIAAFVALILWFLDF
ncbi:MAG TPA: hypothetical protein VFV87_22965 [Pirellulaceae bacterium]|nr:hypothetical protein [Pirellulaceae bacterium]